MDSQVSDMLKYLYNQNKAMELEIKTLTNKMKKHEEDVKLQNLFIEKIAEDDEVILLKKGVFTDEDILLKKGVFTDA
jgi:hypothetical protein